LNVVTTFCAEGYKSLEVEISNFVMGTEPIDGDKNSSSTTTDAGKSYNVFERTKNRQEKEYFLHLVEPIEKGQTVELQFLPSSPPSDARDQDFETKRRHWIQKEIAQLSLKELRNLLDYLNDKIGTTIYRKVHIVFERNDVISDQDSISTSSAIQLAVSRRRMHWVALTINSQLLNEFHRDGLSTMNVVMPTVALAPLWTNELVTSLRKHPDWGDTICPALKKETSREIVAEFSSGEFGDFITSAKIWCPMAEKLFRISVDLFAAFTAELESFCSEEFLVNDLCSMVSKAVLKVKSLVSATDPSDPSAFTDLVLTYRKGTSHNSSALPSMEEVQHASSSLAYLEAMNLCDEPACKPPARDDFRVVATQKVERPEASADPMKDVVEEAKAVMQSVEEMKESKGVIHLKWYIERQILAVVESVALSGVAHVAREAGNLADIRTKIREAAQSAIGEARIQAISSKARTNDGLDSVLLPPQLVGESQGAIPYQPQSSQFFLGLIWPLLKQSGWKLEVGQLSSNVTFFPPGRKKDARTRLLKREASRHRANLTKKTNDLGLGCVPKSTKRLLINSSAIEDEGKFADKRTSVRGVLKTFYSTFRDALADDSEGLRRIQEILRLVESFFEELAPKLLYKEESEKYKLAEGQRMSKVLGCEYLMRLLFVMPNMLQQSDLSIQETDDTLGIVRELMEYLAANHEECFDASLHLPLEDYQDKATFPPYMLSRLEQAKLKKAPGARDGKHEYEVTDSLKEILLPTDRPDLTDFIICVMSQVVFCRATVEDMNRKGRRVEVGRPGLVCRHCLGQSGEGKYFFGNIESLTTASTVVEKHVAKCPKIDQEIKDKVARCKTRHPEQRKDMVPGAQGAFFARLWHRFRMSRALTGAEADPCVTLSTSSGDQQGDDSANDTSTTVSENGLEFKSHIKLMTYLKTTSPWKDKGELQDAIDQYYNCLEYGGRIYNTNAMPLHFSSEWLLAKIAPRGRLGNR
jgi:hypothetical protein